jgi:hypothetical protein
VRIIAFCIHFSIIVCCLYLTCSSVCNYSHILCFLVTQCFVPVCIKHHSCIWLAISLFDSKHLYNNVLLLTCSISYFVFYLWIYGTLNKISYTTDGVSHDYILLSSISLQLTWSSSGWPLNINTKFPGLHLCTVKNWCIIKFLCHHVTYSVTFKVNISA